MTNPSTWNDALKALLTKSQGPKKGQALYQKYEEAFPHSYDDDHPVETAEKDILIMEKISGDHPLSMTLYVTQEKNIEILHLRLYQWQKFIALSDILPMLENLNLRTEDEHPYKITFSDHIIWICDFIIEYRGGKLNLDEIESLFQEAFAKIYFKICEDDGFNKLILGASLSWREVVILRTYAKYLLQVGFRFSQAYIQNALINNAGIAKKTGKPVFCIA